MGEKQKKRNPGKNVLFHMHSVTGTLAEEELKLSPVLAAILQG